MASKIDWYSAVAKLPGIYLEDQEPEGCGLAVSIEINAANRWVVHVAREESGHVKYSATQPLSAYAVYQSLETIYKEIGYVPELTDTEYDMLELPHKDSLFHQTLAGKMPGVYLGMPEDEGMEWAAHYSVEIKGDGRYILYSGILQEGGSFSAEPEIDKNGVYDLSQVLDELRLFGFSPDRLDFLYRLDTVRQDEVERQLPGCILVNPYFEEQGMAVSLCKDTEERWKIFTTKRVSSTEIQIHEQRDLEARQVYTYVYDLLEQTIPDAIQKKLGLPPLEKLYSESISKKLKGFFIGSVMGLDEEGHAQTRFVSLQHEGKEGWVMYYVKSEELITGGRKIVVHKTDPFLEERIYSSFERLDPMMDPLDLYFRLSEQKNPDLSILAKRFEVQMEKK